jgi:hypothetical protein
MKEFISSLICCFSLFIGYSQSENFDGTTIEEYNYLTKGYSIQIEQGLGMKTGYEFASGNDFNQLFSTESSDGKKYNVELKPMAPLRVKDTIAFQTNFQVLIYGQNIGMTFVLLIMLSF